MKGLQKKKGMTLINDRNNCLSFMLPMLLRYLKTLYFTLPTGFPDCTCFIVFS